MLLGDQELAFGLIVLISVILGAISIPYDINRNYIKKGKAEFNGFGFGVFTALTVSLILLFNGQLTNLAETYIPSLSSLQIFVYGFLGPYFFPVILFGILQGLHRSRLKLKSSQEQRQVRRYRENIDQIQDALVRSAETNGGMLTKDEVQDVTENYSRKQVLAALNQLKQDGLMEQESGVYVFPELTNI